MLACGRSLPLCASRTTVRHRCTATAQQIKSKSANGELKAEAKPHRPYGRLFFYKQ